MRKGSGLVLAFALAVPAAFAVPVALLLPEAPALAASDGARGRKDAGAPEAHRDPSNVTGLARWMELCVDGNGKFLGKDYQGALDAYRAAVKLAPRKPLPTYLLGEAHVAMGNLDEAWKSFELAEQSSDKRDPLMRAKVLFVIADLRERQHRWEDAKTAWQAYTEWVFAQSDGGTFPMTAVARVKALDDSIRVDRATQIVRDRIAAAAEAGAFPSPAEAPAKSDGAKPGPAKR